MHAYDNLQLTPSRRVCTISTLPRRNNVAGHGRWSPPAPKGVHVTTVFGEIVELAPAHSLVVFL
jgi:hypothetical protein